MKRDNRPRGRGTLERFETTTIKKKIKTAKVKKYVEKIFR